MDTHARDVSRCAPWTRALGPVGGIADGDGQSRLICVVRGLREEAHQVLDLCPVIYKIVLKVEHAQVAPQRGLCG